MIFDSHAHLIADDDVRYPPSPLSGRVRDGDLAVRFTAETLLRLMDENGVERICAVQRAHLYGYDNSYVVDAASRYPDRMRAVVAIDGKSPAAAQDVYRWMDRGASGIRFAALNAQVLDTDWFTSETALEAWKAAEKTGASVGLHVFRPIRERALAELMPLLDRFPGVNVVVEHISNAALEAGPPNWGVDDALLALKNKRNVFLKLTTINLHRLAEAGIPAAPILDHLVTQLGSGKIMWGSDIAQTKVPYSEMVDLLKQAAAGLGEADCASVFSNTCQTVYGQASGSIR